MGVFGCLGLALGALNNRMLQRSVLIRLRRPTPTARNARSASAAGCWAGSAAITIFAIAIALLVRPDGLGVFAGLAVFQILMLVGAALPVFRSLRPTS